MSEIKYQRCDGSKKDFIEKHCPELGLMEDPVTGSTHCMIAPYWCDRLGKEKLVCYQASERTELAMKNTLFKVSIFDGEKIVAMARAIGDKGLCYYIKDVVVHPGYQGRGLGRILIGEILEYINANGAEGTEIAVELCAMPDKIPFYEKFGFAANEAQRLRIMHKVKVE